MKDLKDQLPDEHWHQVFIRDTERRELWADMACVRVFPREQDGLPGDECWLVIRKDPQSSKDIKYQLSNAPVDTSVDRLGEMSGSRFWIERAFEDGKGIAGLADYQVRSWTGWHHHMTMTILAMLYLMVLLQLGFNTPKLCFDNDTQVVIQNCRSRSEKICSNTPELAPIG